MPREAWRTGAFIVKEPPKGPGMPGVGDLGDPGAADQSTNVSATLAALKCSEGYTPCLHGNCVAELRVILGFRNHQC